MRTCLTSSFDLLCHQRLLVYYLMIIMLTCSKILPLDEIPAVCGGMGPNGEIYSECYLYDATIDSWTKSGDLSQGRSSPGVAYNLVFGLVMAGGFSKNYLSSVEYTRNGINSSISNTGCQVRSETTFC